METEEVQKDLVGKGQDQGTEEMEISKEMIEEMIDKNTIEIMGEITIVERGDE